MVGDRERIAARFVAKGEVPFEVDAPQIVGALARVERHERRRRAHAPTPGPNQAGALEQATDRARRRQLQLRTAAEQHVAQLLGRPVRELFAKLDELVADLIGRAMWASMRRTRLVL
jgi:hypothetical protein